MYRSLWGSPFACALIIVAPGLTQADTISPDIPNAGFAPLTVVEDHPQCSGPGEVAFEVVFEAPQLAFRATENDTLNAAQIGADGQVVVEDARCYITERRGTERVQVEIDCAKGQITQSPFRLLDLDNIDMSLAGRFLACQSPTQFELIESNWFATVRQDGQSKAFQSEFYRYPADGCEGITSIETPTAIFDYAIAGVSGTPTSHALRYSWRGPQEIASQPPTYFSVALAGIPLLERDDRTNGVSANTTAFFFPTAEGESNCHDGECRLPDWLLSNNLRRLQRVCR